MRLISPRGRAPPGSVVARPSFRSLTILIVALTLASALPPTVPAARPAVLPFQDSFESDTIANGDWDVIQPVTASIANGDLRLELPATLTGGGLGGITRPVVLPSGPVIYESHLRVDRSYRVGIAFRDANAMTVLLEAAGSEWLLSYHDATGRWRNHGTGAAVVEGAEVFVRFVLRDDGTLSAEVYDATGTRKGYTIGRDAQLRPASVQRIEVAVWRDHGGNPLSRATVHDVALRQGDLDLRATQTSPGTVRVEWPDVSPGGTYLVYRRSPSEPETLEGTTSATSFVETGLPTAKYTYRVVSQRAVFVGLPVSVDVTSGFAGRPRLVSAAPGPTPGELRLDWDPPVLGASLVTSYRLYAFSPTGVYRDLVPGTATSAIDRYLEPGVHKYYLASVSPQGEGEYLIFERTIASGPLVVGLGDSVGAGHGLGPSTGYRENNAFSYSQVLGRELKGTAMTFAISGACANAQGIPGASPSTSPSCDPARTLFGEIAELRREMAVSGAQPSLITISIGGNDIDFAKCMAGYLGAEELGPCEPETLQRHLNGLRENLVRSINDLQDTYPSSPIVITQYYDPFPKAQATPACPVFMGMAAPTQNGANFNQTDGDWEVELAAAQARADRTVDDILEKLNGALAAMARPGVAIVPVDFSGHDMCSEWRFREGRVEPTGYESFVYSPSMTITKVDHFQNDQAFTRSWGPEPTVCGALDEDPPREKGTKEHRALGILVVSVHYDISVNCTPHPTALGQEAIARAVLARLRAPPG